MTIRRGNLRGVFYIVCVWKWACLIALLLNTVSCTSISVVTANLWERQDEESLEEAVLRQHSSGMLIREKDPIWTLVATNEVLHSRKRQRPGGGWVKAKAKSVRCPFDSTSDKVLALFCFTRGLYPNRTPKITHHVGELGIVGNESELVQLPISPTDERSAPFGARHIGKKERGSIRRRALASRFTITRFKRTILFVSTHLSHGGNRSHDERAREIEDLLKRILEWYREGELTPVLAGDLNCGDWTAREREVILEHFFYADSYLGIDHIMIGRPQSFPNNAGFLTPVEGSTRFFTPIDSRGERLSDHDFVSVDLELDPRKQTPYLVPPVVTRGEGCWNP